MNAERLNKVADMIQAYPEHFDMSWFVKRGDEYDYNLPLELAQSDLFECGTTGCIAGWVLHLWPAEVTAGDVDVVATAGRILGMGRREAHDLFMDWEEHEDTADGCAHRLRRMALEAEFGS